ncbi:succinylglutamate desuccinylase/aspartoacylase family protein [Candidatus Saccharibacteria bacterium]|nr:succinylglutamate desuccinylase/aspartoacylase family protein [Candidatus Saccharibacteria bacterium]
MKFIQNNSISKVKVTLVCCVHGNEKFGKKVFDYFLLKLEKFPGLSLLLANEEAMKINRRFVDIDLNRSFTSHKNSKLHEAVLAEKIKKVIDPHSIIIDIHTTKTRLKAISIVTNLTTDTKKILKVVPYKEVAYMKQGFGSLISQYQSAVSLEYNRDYVKQKAVLKKLEVIVTSLLDNKNDHHRYKTIYKSIGILPLGIKIPKKPKDFYHLAERDTYVLFPRHRAVKGFKGFEMKKVSNHLYLK